jgi:hypothetical protein
MLAFAQRCVGAQYVASLDLKVEGGLVQMPQVGSSMLFARSEDGRVALVRTAPLTAFEAQPGDADAPPRRFDLPEPRGAGNTTGRGEAAMDESIHEIPTLKREPGQLPPIRPPKVPPPPRSYTRDSMTRLQAPPQKRRAR